MPFDHQTPSALENYTELFECGFFIHPALAGLGDGNFVEIFPDVETMQLPRRRLAMRKIWIGSWRRVRRDRILQRRLACPNGLPLVPRRATRRKALVSQATAHKQEKPVSNFASLLCSFWLLGFIVDFRASARQPRPVKSAPFRSNANTSKAISVRSRRLERRFTLAQRNYER